MGAVCVNDAGALPVFNAAVVSVIAGAITVAAAPMVAGSSPVTSAAVFNVAPCLLFLLL